MEMHEETNFDDEEERYHNRQRRASFGGLLAGLFILFLFGVGLIALTTFWPRSETAPFSQPSSFPKPAE
jgi:hypothetical protein